jgi:hypothetical protein
MPDYWCAECGLPADVPAGSGGGDNFSCWACGGPVVSDVQIALWNNPATVALVEERVQQLRDGESVELARGGRRAKFAVGTAADYLMIEALGL